MVEGQVEKVENLIVEVFAADAYDITVGEIVTPYNSAGVKTAVSSDKGPYFMAMMPENRNNRDIKGSTLAYDHDVDGVTDNLVPCVVVGVVDCAAAPAAAIDKGEYVKISATAGHVTLSSVTNEYEIVGIAMEAMGTAAAHGLVLLGHFP